MNTAVIFLSEGGKYALGIDVVTEISTGAALTQVPGLPDYIAGVMNLRGEVLPVVDFRKRLGFKDIDHEGRETLLILEINGTTVALRTDAVVTAFDYEDEEIVPFEDDSVVSGLVDYEGERVTLVNAEKLL